MARAAFQIHDTLWWPAAPRYQRLTICAPPRTSESWGMDRPTKITFAEMRDSGVRGILIYCSDYTCSHSIAIVADRWADDLRLSDIEPRFVRRVCGHRGT